MEPHSFSGATPVSTTARDDLDGALLLEEGTDRGTQFFLLSRELELHRTPFPALPVASPTSSRAIPGAARSGRVYLTPMSVSAALCYLHDAPFSGKDVVGCALGGRRSEAQARTGDAGGHGNVAALPDA